MGTSTGEGSRRCGDLGNIPGKCRVGWGGMWSNSSSMGEGCFSVGLEGKVMGMVGGGSSEGQEVGIGGGTTGVME